MEPFQPNSGVFFAKVWLGLFFCRGVARSFLVFEAFKCSKLQQLLVLKRLKCCKLLYLLVLERFKCVKLQYLLVLQRLHAANYSMCETRSNALDPSKPTCAPTCLHPDFEQLPSTQNSILRFRVLGNLARFCFINCPNMLAEQ